MSPGEEDMAHFSDRRHRLNAEGVGPVMGVGGIRVSERRHRLQPEEVPAVMTAVRLRLRELCVDRGDLGEAGALFRVLFRFVEHRPGTPAYPPPSWEAFSRLANGSTVDQEVVLDAPHHPEKEGLSHV